MGLCLASETQHVLSQDFPALLMLRHGTRMDTNSKFNWCEYNVRWYDSPIDFSDKVMQGIEQSVAFLKTDAALQLDPALIDVGSSPFLRCVETAGVVATALGSSQLWVHSAVFAKPSQIDCCLREGHCDVGQWASLGLRPFAAVTNLACNEISQRCEVVRSLQLLCDAKEILPKDICDATKSVKECDDAWQKHVVDAVLALWKKSRDNGRTLLLVTHGEVMKAVIESVVGYTENAQSFRKVQTLKVNANAWVALKHITNNKTIIASHFGIEEQP